MFTIYKLYRTVPYMYRKPLQTEICTSIILHVCHSFIHFFNIHLSDTTRYLQYFRL